METRTFKEKTILVDPAANRGKNYDFTEDSIAHECNHIFWHQPCQKMQTVHRERMALAGLDCDLETILLENNEQEELKLIERQARALTPRVRMPAAQVTKVARGYQRENMRHYGNSGRAAEKRIGQTAVFFGSSKVATKNRLHETGNRDVEGILVHCNGHYLPRHSWSRTLQYGETYSIESSQLTELRSREPVLNALLAYEAAVYVDGFVCMNDPQYVTSGKWGRQLTPRALNDRSRCCLLFRIHREREDNEYTYGVLNSIDKRGMEHVSFDISSVSSVLEEAEIARGIRKNLPDEFLETLEGYIRALDISKNQLAAVTTMDEDRLKNIRRNKVKSVSFDEVFLLGLGLGLQPEELDDLMEKSTAKFDRSERCSIVRVLYRKLYEYPVTTFNEALIACNQDPLSNAS